MNRTLLWLIIAAVLVIATAGLAVAAFCATTLTHSYLLSQVDNSLMHARIPVANRYGGVFGGGFSGSTRNGAMAGITVDGCSTFAPK